MSWKKKFAANVRYEDLPNLTKFRIIDEPESLGKGKYRVRLETETNEFQLPTYEGTIGDIVYAQGDGWCEAYSEIGSDGNTYIRFRGVE